MKQEILIIKNHKILIKELTVRDVCSIWTNLDDILNEEDIEAETLTPEKLDLIRHIAKSFIIMPEDFTIEKLSAEHLELIAPVFMRVNQSFYDNTKKQPKQNPRAKKQPTNNLIKDLNRSIYNLIASGHKDVFDYAWSFYLDVIEFIKEQEK